MIDGLKLTMTGQELRKRLDERVKDHERQAAWYKAEAKREPDPDDENDFGLPEHMCEFEQEFHGWRAEALAYIREHVEGGEVYRLDQTDLAFGEILPEKPGIVEQADYEGEQRIGFSLERIAKEIGRSTFDPFNLADLPRPKLPGRDRTTRPRPAARRPAKARSK
jgi:hypothetical protein